MRVKYLIPFLILILIFSFACGGTPKEVTKTEEKEPELPEKVIEEEIIEEVEEIVEVSLKIAVWNDTEKNEPNLEIWIKGTGSWYPDKESMEFGGDFFVPVEPFSSGKVNEIYIYPDGRAGSEIMVEITVTDEMTPESDRDTIHIEIYDETVIVIGTSVEGITKEFKR
jgi:hypothetical protein